MASPWQPRTAPATDRLRGDPRGQARHAPRGGGRRWLPGVAREAFHLFVHGAAPASVRLDGGDVSLTSGQFVLPNAARAFPVEFDL